MELKRNKNLSLPWTPQGEKASGNHQNGAVTKPGPDRIGSDRIDKTRTGSDRINKTWIGLRPIDKTRTGSEKNRIAINFRQNSHETSHDQVLA